jgi:TolB protein
MKKYCLLLFACLFSFAATAEDTTTSSGIYIDVGQANIQQSLLAFPQPIFQMDTANVSPLTMKKSGLDAGHTIYETIVNDLTATGLFKFLKEDAFLEDPKSRSLKPIPNDPNGFKFDSWKAIKTDFLIRAGYRVGDGEKVKFEVYVYYVPQSKLVLGRVYEGDVKSARRIAHTFSNDILKALTGKPGIFLSKIVVSSDRSNPPSKIGDSANVSKEIFVMDWDGENAKQITQHQSLAISPAWSPDGTKVAYTCFAYHKNAHMRNADLFLYELDTGKRFLISYRKGINSGAAFAPDGKYLYFTMSQGGSPDIFRMSYDGQDLSPITHGPDGVMNVEPAVSPDGKKIAFSSDRSTYSAGSKSGRPMIYIMDIDGRNVKRVTYAGKYNSTPTWSPDGKTLAFAGHDADHFDIFIIKADGTGLQRLTEATRVDTKRPASNEDPTFSPDGRFIMFVSDRSGNKQLYTIAPDGTNERRITYDKFNYYKPKWSSRLE